MGEQRVEAWKRDMTDTITKFWGQHLLPNFHRPVPPNSTPAPPYLSNLLPVAISLIISTSQPALAIPSVTAGSPSSLPPTTPFSQAKNMPVGLQNGKIRACPSINPGCVSTNPSSASFAFPWVIPETSTKDAVKQLEEAIVKTQKNTKIQSVEEAPNGGTYLQAEVDGGFGRDVMEFLVKGDAVTYRAMAMKVIYVYPFTTAFGNSDGQQERANQIVQHLGWYAPTLDLTDEDR